MAQRGATFLYGQLIIVLVLSLGGIWVATEWVAQLLGFQPALGQPWFAVAHWPIYYPWQYLTWLYHYGDYAPHAFDTVRWASFGGPALAVLVAAIMSLVRAKGERQRTTYGTARWAGHDDLEAAGLLGQRGVVLGVTDGGEYLRHDGPEHVAMIAPTRSGKGVSVVIPTLLTWPGSVVVTDMKKEAWKYTAGYRRRFSHVILFNPAERGTAHFNPLLEIRRGDNEVKDAQTVADMLVDPEGTGERNHWTDSAHSLLTGAILHVLYTAPNKSLPGVRALLTDPGRTLFDTFTEMLGTVHDPHGATRYGWTDPLTGRPTNTHPVIAATAREMLNKSDNELSGVVSTAQRNLSIYQDPVLAAAVGDSDFQIEDLMNSERPVSLYIGIPPSDLDRLRPLFRLVLNQIVRRLTEQLDEEPPAPTVGARVAAWLRRQLQWAPEAPPPPESAARHRHRLLMLLDEFPALGRLNSIESALAFIGGYGIKALLIVQSRNQLDKAYGPHNSILDACKVRQVFTPNDTETAKLISQMTGQSTVVHQQRNYAGNRLAPWLGHVMVMDQEAARPLLTEGEVLQLAETDALLFVAGRPPYRARKLRYFEDPNFKPRVLPPPPIPLGARYPYRPADPENPWTHPAGRPAPHNASAAPSATEGGVDLQNTDRKLEQADPPPPPKVPALGVQDTDLDADAQAQGLVAATLQAAVGPQQLTPAQQLAQVAVLSDEDQLTQEAKEHRHELARDFDQQHDSDMGLTL